MTKRKKLFVILSVSLLIIIASGFGFVVITGACGGGPFSGPMKFRTMSHHGFHKKGMPLFMQKEIGNFMIWKMDKGIKHLDLSKIQQKNYEDFRSQLEMTMETGIKTRMEFKQKTLSEFEKENPDIAVISGGMQSGIELMSNSISENLSLFTKFYNSLNDKQKNLITEKIKEHIELHENYNQDNIRCI
jgi:hypothetical protein